MSEKKYSIVALGTGGVRRTVAYYDRFTEAFDAMDDLTLQGGSMGFHVKYDLLYDGQPFFWTLSDSRSAEDVAELLEAWDMFTEGISKEEMISSVKAAMDAGVIVATGDVVAILKEEEQAL